MNLLIKISSDTKKFSPLNPSGVWKCYLMRFGQELTESELESVKQYVGTVGETVEATLPKNDSGTNKVYILKKPGVTDPIEQFAMEFFRNNGLKCLKFQEGYLVEGKVNYKDQDLAGYYNPIIEGVYRDLKGYLLYSPAKSSDIGTVQFTRLKANELLDISRQLRLSLNVKELQAIQEYFIGIGREPTDCELETIAQTWSEHCKHKTITSPVEFNGEIINGLLQETVFRVTSELKRDFCLSVFKDNAGIIRLTDEYAVSAKVETHNHPSAIEPFGGSNTGLGGVIRDVLGCGLVSKPIASIDIFAVGHVKKNYEDVNIDQKRLLRELVRGVGDYGNKIGIPTVAGAVVFDDRYRFNPLVYCGTFGVISPDSVNKNARPGDYIVLIGGKTGRDGLHGATFSSAEMTTETETEFTSSVQIGNPIEEKKILDLLVEASGKEFINSITDCGAGGFSSAVCEMGRDIGVRVQLEKVPVKYSGLSPKEIWLSESQERMILAIDRGKFEEFEDLSGRHNVECVIIGEFVTTGKAEVMYNNNRICDLDMKFLHDGLPRDLLIAKWERKTETVPSKFKVKPGYEDEILDVLGYPDVASKEWIVRRYDHEVFGRTILKPYSGIGKDSPSDGSVVLLPDFSTGLAVAVGLSHRFADIDPYQSACNSIDEAVRNLVSVGADPMNIALLDNFCWPSVTNEDDLGALVLACKACYDVARAYGTPFISGKDSLNNEYVKNDGSTVKIPYTLLITAIGRVADTRHVKSSDFKGAGNSIYALGLTLHNLTGSVFSRVNGEGSGSVPAVLPDQFIKLYRAVYMAINNGVVESVHDISDGGLSSSVMESCIGGDIGAYIDLVSVPAHGAIGDHILLFSETPGRFIIEVKKDNEHEFQKFFEGIPHQKIGYTREEGKVIFKGLDSFTEIDLQEAKNVWKEPLNLDGNER